MSNEPNNKDAKPTPPIPPLSEGQRDEEVFDLSDLEALPLADAEALAAPDEALPPLSEAVSFEVPPPVVDDLGSLTVGVSLEDLPELANLPSPSGNLGEIPNADPASAVPLHTAPGSSVVIASAADSSDALGNLEPPTPVAPASGWLDSEAAAPALHDDFDEPLGVHPADLLDAPPAIESSDIFSGGGIPTATTADHSDVISATARGSKGPTPSGKPPRPSEVALTFDQPLGGSTDREPGASGDLPVAEEESTNPRVPLSSASLKGNTSSQQQVPDEGPDFGSMPIATSDASSILSDLSDPGEISFDESSSVRLESPGVGRTHGSDHGEGTEFDLEISQDPVHPELKAAAEDDEPTDWRQQSSSDLFAERRTAPEIDLAPDSGRVDPADIDFNPEQPSLTSAPSSIFSGEKLPGVKKSSGPASDSVRIGRPGEEEEAVEFTDHPSAEPESSSAALLGPQTPTVGAGKVDHNAPRKSSTKLSARKDDADDTGRVDWDALAMADESEATIGVPREVLEEAEAGELKRGKKADQAEPKKPSKTKEAVNKKGQAKPGKTSPGKGTGPDGTDPSVEIDWMAGSSEEAPVVSEASPSEKKGKGKKDTGRDKKSSPSSKETSPSREKKGGAGGWIGGSLLGMVLAGGACAGLYYGGVIPNGETPNSQQAAGQGRQTGPGPSAENKSAPTLADAHAALNSGQPAQALKVLETVKSGTPDNVSPETRAASGQARLFARLQELGKANTAVTTEDAELKKAREDLEAVVNDKVAAKSLGDKAMVRSTIHLGLTYELAGDTAKAKDVYEQGKQKFPAYASTFDAALDRLAATAPAGTGVSLRVDPVRVEQLLFVLVMLQAEPAPKETEEAGVYFWKAVKLASGEKFAEAIDEIKKAKAAHVKQAKASAGVGLNPLSDPLEQIFPRCCDDLKAYWELRAVIYANKPIAELVQKEGAEKAMKELAAAQQKAVEAVKAMADLKTATAKLTKAEKDLQEAQAKYAVQEKELKDLAAKSKDELAKAEDSLLKAESSRKKAEEVIAFVAKELQTIKLLPDQFDTEKLLAAQKTAVDRASGPTLSTLVPPGMMAVAGPLSSAQLIDISGRLTKSEAAAKTATEKLEAETKRLTTEKDEAVKKLKDSHATDVKKLTDDYAAETKKLMQTYATSTDKLKADQLADLKKASDKFAADVKKLTDDNTAAAKKLTEGFEGKIKGLEEAVATEKKAGEAAVAKYKTDLANAVSPAQALDLWLPQLTELRRESDAEPALANANKVLATAAPDSEDAAKARTVAGLALLLQKKLDQAKTMFELALASPAHKAAAGKEWAKVAEVGLASVSDPLAPYRLPIEKPKRDVKAGAFYLDRGVSAYKSGRFADAAKDLAESTKADPTSPVAWYFLGAARWANGDKDQAKNDFRQGGEWEKQAAMTSRDISASLEAIQGAARDALSAARP